MFLSATDCADNIRRRFIILQIKSQELGSFTNFTESLIYEFYWKIHESVGFDWMFRFHRMN